MNIIELSVDSIVANPHQPRKIFDDAKLKELSDSIEEFGVLQPLSVRKSGDKYELIAGERRLLASKKAGLKVLPCHVLDIDDADSAFISLIENLQREDLSFYEEALAYKDILEEFSLTQTELASRLAISQSAIANKLRILNIDSDILEELVSSNLSERHARALLKLDDKKKQKRVLKKIIKDDLNVAQTEEYIRKLLKINKPKRTVVKQSMKDIRVFTNTLKELIKSVEKAGLDVDFDISQNDDFYDFSIRVKRMR